MADTIANLSGAELVHRARRGSDAAYAEIYDRYYGPIRRYAWVSAGDEGLAEEIAQEVFLELLRRPNRFDPARGELGAFLHGIAHNLIRRHWQKQRRNAEQPLPENDGLDGAEFDSEDDVELDFSLAESRERLRREVMALPLEQRQAVTLVYMDGLTREAAARILACGLGTLNSRLGRARARLVLRLRPVVIHG